MKLLKELLLEADNCAAKVKEYFSQDTDLRLDVDTILFPMGMDCILMRTTYWVLNTKYCANTYFFPNTTVNVDETIKTIKNYVLNSRRKQGCLDEV